MGSGGAMARVVQKLARHLDPKLTFNPFARVFDKTEQEMIPAKTDSTSENAHRAMRENTRRWAKCYQGHAYKRAWKKGEYFM